MLENDAFASQRPNVANQPTATAECSAAKRRGSGSAEFALLCHFCSLTITLTLLTIYMPLQHFRNMPQVPI